MQSQVIKNLIILIKIFPMKFQFSTLLILVLNTCIAFSQVGINGDGSVPDPSAMLDIKSTTHGLLIPRMSDEAQNRIPSPATGLLVYNTTNNSLNFFNGSAWFQIESSLCSSTIGSSVQGGGISISSEPVSLANPSAILDISDSSRGLLLPHIAPNQISNPVTGLIIFSILTNRLIYFNGSQWVEPCAVWTGNYGSGGTQHSIGVSINATGAAPDPSAMLDISSVDKGMLIPRMSDSDRDNLLPAVGLTIYNTSENTIEFYNGTGWYRMNTPSEPSISITPTATLLQSGDSVTFTVNTVNGGTSPSYQWSVNYSVTGSGPVFSYIPTNGDLVQCILISSETCVTTPVAYSQQVQLTVTTPCPGISHVAYAGKTYHTVKVGNQCWMRENLNVGALVSRWTEQTNNQVIEKYCYNDEEDNCTTYGALYQWGEVVQYKNGASNTTNWNPVPDGYVQGLCPLGWHIPQATEWTELINNAGGANIALSTLKEAGASHWALTVPANNNSGFTALPSGARFNGGIFMGVDYNQFAMHWSSAIFNTEQAWYFYLDRMTVTGESYMATKKHGYAIRCLKDICLVTSPPSVVTTVVSGITVTSAVSGGTVEANGCITASGVCWSTSPNPTISDNHTEDGSSSGSFTSTITGLTQNTQYFIRAYATNILGTSYGNEETFTTSTAIYSIGQSYGGGIIFYIDPSGVHGLIASSVDQGNWNKWGCMGTFINGASGTAIGTGHQNTINIVNGCSASDNAAYLCDQYTVTVNGVVYDDWYLPSKDELNEMYLQNNVLGIIDNGYGYWSSSGIDYVTAFSQEFMYGSSDYSLKNQNKSVRAIRSF